MKNCLLIKGFKEISDSSGNAFLVSRSKHQKRIESKKWRFSASSFMPFNLQIFLPRLLIPMKHVWEARKVLALLSRNPKSRGRKTKTEGVESKRKRERNSEKKRAERVKNSREQRWRRIRAPRGRELRFLARGEPRKREKGV